MRRMAGSLNGYTYHIGVNDCTQRRYSLDAVFHFTAVTPGTPAMVLFISPCVKPFARMDAPTAISSGLAKVLPEESYCKSIGYHIRITNKWSCPWKLLERQCRIGQRKRYRCFSVASTGISAKWRNRNFSRYSYNVRCCCHKRSGRTSILLCSIQLKSPVAVKSIQFTGL